MEEIIPCAVGDQEVFRRVWQRVMGDRSDEDCPVMPIPANMQGDLSCECLAALVQQNQAGQTSENGQDQPAMENESASPSEQTDQQSEDAAEAGWTTREPENQELMGRDDTMTAEQMGQESADMAQDRAEREMDTEQTDSGMMTEQAAPEPSCGMRAETAVLPPENGSNRGNDLPQLWEEPQETSDRTGRMRRQVMEALEGWQFYRHLARRARGNDARTLNALAGDAHKAARKLSAAYFLLTGVRYWPSELLGTPAIPSYWGALRNCHQTEQRKEMDYRISADDWNDQDQTELYQSLMEGTQARLRQLRTLLEEDHTT